MTDRADNLEQALCWTGFRPLSPAEASSGPFTREPHERRFLRLDATTYNIALVSSIESDVELIHVLDHIGMGAWGYDLNIESHADQTAIVNEIRFIRAKEPSALLKELSLLGFLPRGESWVRSEPACRVPSLGPDFRGEIFPCLGWVLMPEATSEFGPAEQRSGFCSTVIPAQAKANHASRAFHFVYDGFPQKTITRRRIMTLIGPQTPPAAIHPIVERALALTYGAM